MLNLLLCVALAAGGAHAPLHPANADLYLDIGSGKELFAARERAPFNKLFADEELKGLYKLLESFRLPVQSLGEAALPAAFFGEASPLRALQHASFSVSGLDLFDGNPSNLHIGIEGVLDFADPAAAGALLAALDGWKALAPSSDAALAKECQLGDQRCALRWYTSAAEPLPAQSLWVAQAGARLYAGTLESPPERLAARLSGKEPGLAEEAQLFSGTAAMSPSAGLSIYRLWSDVDMQAFLRSPETLSYGAGAKVTLPWIVPTLFPSYGAQGIWRVELRGERFVTESVYRRYPEFESKAVGNGIVDASAARFVPKEAVGAWITNVDGAALEGELRTLVGALLAKDKDGKQEALKELPPLAEGLGTHAAFYLLPINGIQAIVPRAFLALELKDKPKFEAALAAWAAKLAQIDPQARVVNKPYRKLTCVSLSFGKEPEAEAPGNASPLGGMTPDLSLSPTIVVFEDRVLFATKKNYAQTETRRIADGKSSEPHALANPETFPKDVFEASVMDWGGFFGKLLDIAKGLAPMAAGMMGENAPQIDAAALPGSATLARYFKPTTSWSKRLPDGRTYTYAESSFGPETPLQILLFSGTAGSVLKQRAAAEAAGPATIEPLVESKAATETQATLLHVKTAVAIFRIENAKLPAKLEDLLQPSDRYPDGLLAPQKELPKDGWGHALAFKPEADGKRFLLYSFGPDGKDDLGAGDDLQAR